MDTECSLCAYLLIYNNGILISQEENEIFAAWMDTGNTMLGKIKDNTV